MYQILVSYILLHNMENMDLNSWTHHDDLVLMTFNKTLSHIVTFWNDTDLFCEVIWDLWINIMHVSWLINLSSSMGTLVGKARGASPTNEIFWRTFPSFSLVNCFFNCVTKALVIFLYILTPEIFQRTCAPNKKKRRCHCGCGWGCCGQARPWRRPWPWLSTCAWWFARVPPDLGERQ